jgi:pimeloyl-ACP methyl ester carboxylesterase
MSVCDDFLSRRGLVFGSILAGIAGAASAAETQPANRDTIHPMPAQAPAREGLAQLPDTRLWYSDSGGSGPVVVFLHPASGSALIWGYQQPIFAAAGHRVIAYSRRGYYNSEPVPKDNPGIGSLDLHNLIALLGVEKFHVIASAGGVGIALDYALSHPERLLSMVLANGTGLAQGAGGISDAEYVKSLARVRTKGFDDMPVEFRELSPSYRAINPEGVRLWLELHRQAFSGNRVGQKPANQATWAALQGMKVPTLLMTGDADLIWPPPLLRSFARNIPNSESAVVAEAGHSVYWEQPEIFNRIVLDFIGRHSR